MLKLAKLDPVDSIYSLMPSHLRATANPDERWFGEVGAFITKQFLRILFAQVWTAEEAQAYARLFNTGTASQSDLVKRPLIERKIDTFILGQTEELGALIRESIPVKQRILIWMQTPGKREWLIEFHKREIRASDVWQGHKRPRIENNPREYESKAEMLIELQSLAAMLHTRDLLDEPGAPQTRRSGIEAVIREFESIVKAKDLRLLADPVNLKLWTDFLSAEENERFVFDLLERPNLPQLYDAWRAWYLPGISPEKSRSLISLSARRA
jgi:hypothetical protein